MQITFKKTTVINLIIAVETIVLILATVFCLVTDFDLLKYLYLNQVSFIHMMMGLALGIMMSFFSIFTMKLVSKFPEKMQFLSNYQELVNTVMKPLFSSFSIFEIVLVSIASGFCEEVFYRGVLQSSLGIYIASFIFGICHYAGAKYLLYVVWATIAGLLFGALFIYTGSLWPAILAHMANNFVSICFLRYSNLNLETESKDID